MTALEITHVGLHATVQDLGRTGFLGQGITVGGAVDSFALRCANALLGNSPGSAGLEVVLAGIKFQADQDIVVSVTGAPAPIRIDGEAQAMNRPLRVGSGSSFELGPSSAGSYTYIAVAGGIDTPPVLGSRSTVVREGLGGLEGRALKRGDSLACGSPNSNTPPLVMRKGYTHRGDDGSQRASTHITLRFIPGFHHDAVNDECRTRLCSDTFAITGSANRMATPLDGPPLNTGLTQLWSEATALGSIQVPPSGQPIVLLNDRQTMGGYPQMGAVIPPDCVRLAQARPGCKVDFQRISVEEADRISWLTTHYEEARLSAITTLWGQPV